MKMKTYCIVIRTVFLVGVFAAFIFIPNEPADIVSTKNLLMMGCLIMMLMGGIGEYIAEEFEKLNSKK